MIEILMLLNHVQSGKKPVPVSNHAGKPVPFRPAAHRGIAAFRSTPTTNRFISDSKSIPGLARSCRARQPLAARSGRPGNTVHLKCLWLICQISNPTNAAPVHGIAPPHREGLTPARPRHAAPQQRCVQLDMRRACLGGRVSSRAQIARERGRKSGLARTLALPGLGWNRELDAPQARQRFCATVIDS